MIRKRPANYYTRQGQSILEYMKSLSGGHVTVNQIVRHFEDAEEAIGQTTVYRHLEKLAAGGKIRKYILPKDKSACYQYLDGGAECREHFHLKCETCGRLIHVDCSLLDNIEKHLLSGHDFQLNMFKTVFYGICKECLAGVQVTGGMA